MISFYTLPSTVMHHPVHKQLKAAYSFYNVSEETPLIDLMQDALILAKQVRCACSGNRFRNLRLQGASYKMTILVLSSEWIKVDLPPWKIWKDGVSSVSDRQTHETSTLLSFCNHINEISSPVKAWNFQIFLQPRSQGPLLPVSLSLQKTGRRGPWVRGWSFFRNCSIGTAKLRRSLTLKLFPSVV